MYIVKIRKDTWFNVQPLWFADVQSSDGKFHIKNWKKAFKTKKNLLKDIKAQSSLIDKIIDHNGVEIEATQ